MTMRRDLHHDEKNQYDIVVSDERLIVYEVNASITVEDVDRSVKTIRENLKAAEGYETETSKNNNGYFYCTLSVPTKNLAEFLNTLEGVGNMNSCTVSSEDITEQYTSIEAQKAVYVKQQELLEAELAATTDIKEKREIISALAEIAVKLDGYDTDLKNLKKRAEFSTVYLRVYEKNTYAPPSYWDELGEVLFGSTSAAGAFVGFLLKVIAALLPFAVLAAIVYGLVILVIFIVCKAKKRPFDMFRKAKEKRRNTLSRKNVAHKTKGRLSRRTPQTHKRACAFARGKTKLTEKKKSILLSLIALLVAVILAVAGFLLNEIVPKKQENDKNKALSQNVCAVEIQCGQNTGTGFIYECDGNMATVVTCLHVVKKDISGARFRFYDKSAFVFSESTLGFDENADLAVFKVKYDLKTDKPNVKDPVTGDEITLFGNSAGSGIAAFFGKVSAVNTVIKCEDEDGSFLNGKFMPAVGITADVNAGSSGGPVFDNDGNFVGMGFYQNFGTIDRPIIGQSYMIPARLISALVKTYEDGSKMIEKLDYTLYSGYRGEGENLFRVTEVAFKNADEWSEKVFREINGAIYMCEKDDYAAENGKKVKKSGILRPQMCRNFLPRQRFIVTSRRIYNG